MRRSKLQKSVTVLAALLSGTGSAVSLAAPALAATTAGPDLKIVASDDTYTSSSRKTANFGTEDKLAIGRLGADTKQSYLKFVVPANAKVTGAKLRLTAIGTLAGKITVNRILNNTWTEKSLTATNAPALGLAVAAATPKSTATEVDFDLGAEVYGPGTYSFVIRSSSSAAVTRFHSAEDITGAPQLTVSTAAVTAPATTSKPASTTTTTKPASTTPATTTPATTTPTTTPATTTPATTTPTTTPATTPATTTPANTNCTTGALLVPSCGVLWGAAAGGFTSAPRDQANKDWEALSGRTATIFHTYHKGDEPFPTKAEIAMTEDAAHPRVLLMNWKIAYGSSWAKVAAGDEDKRIDAFAARAKAFGKKFFLVLNHEPENDVIATAGSGMEAKDFAAMYRHTVLRLRGEGVANMVNVIAYMGNEKWMAQSWWKDLYPGDDVVDWVGLDSYVSVETGAYHYGMVGDLLDRAAPGGQGWYDWATTKHPSKPVMVAEWGAYHRVGHPADKTAQFNSMLPELAKRPAIKAIVYFDTAHDDQGDRDISINSTPANLAAFRQLAANPLFNVKIGN